MIGECLLRPLYSSENLRFRFSFIAQLRSLCTLDLNHETTTSQVKNWLLTV